MKLLHRFDDISSLERGQGIDELRRDQVVVLHAHLECNEYSEVISRQIAQDSQVEFNHLGPVVRREVISRPSHKACGPNSSSILMLARLLSVRGYDAIRSFT